MKLKRILSLLLVLCIAAFSTFALADFGDYSGDSDYGYDSGSSWDSDYSSSSSSSWDDDDDYYYSGSSSYHDDDDGDGDPVLGAVVLLIIIVLVLYGRKKKRGGGNRATTVNPGARRTDVSTLKPMSEYKKIDPNFDEAAFSEKLSNMYVQMQNGWTDKDITPLRPYFTDAFYNQMARQLENMKKAGRTNYVERIAVLGVTLLGFKQEGDEDHIIAEIRTRIVDYTVDDRTGNVVSGSRNNEKFMTYEWSLCRAKGEVTGQRDAMTKINCPNCGAPLEINATAKCPYCDTVVELKEHDWALYNIKGISQRTN